MLNVLDEVTRESLAIRVRRRLSSSDVIDVLTDLFILRGVPGYIRSDNGPEFVAEAVRRGRSVRPVWYPIRLGRSQGAVHKPRIVMEHRIPYSVCQSRQVSGKCRLKLRRPHGLPC